MLMLPGISAVHEYCSHLNQECKRCFHHQPKKKKNQKANFIVFHRPALSFGLMIQRVQKIT